MSYRDRVENQRKPGQPISGSIEEFNEKRRVWQLELIKKEGWQTCLNCIEWSDGKGTDPVGCKLNRAFPPPDIIVTGCKDHMTDIPF